MVYVVPVSLCMVFVIRDSVSFYISFTSESLSGATGAGARHCVIPTIRYPVFVLTQRVLGMSVYHVINISACDSVNGL